MLNRKSQLLVAAAVVAGSFGATNSASAGEGGVAGSASFQLTGGDVTQASAAVAVGKSTAYAGAATFTGFGTEAFAVGTGGDINLSGSSVYITSITGDTNLGAAQVNDLNDNDVNINVITGETNVINTVVAP
ncbi:MAG: hypothetical protein EAZ87_16640 [Nostocales cyanobacterium]|nr:MAG: hypothetical protein EAZ87_16640 [Nostocales cyanobacterium]